MQGAAPRHLHMLAVPGDQVQGAGPGVVRWENIPTHPHTPQVILRIKIDLILHISYNSHFLADWFKVSTTIVSVIALICKAKINV